ncbi:LOB domain-containing protein 25-like [Telopea speciosissima]|uniref:LOB domain-containing protein 25-like n=1 Tax=Telopea speciosissima TaxID=54955 RepID=UPI001CC7CFF7|nr:LOB domain-containing protein 25-like [Telopea speciosissima]
MDVGLMPAKAWARVKINQPCAACRMLRRRCGSDCLLAPYFPPEEFNNFVVVHKVFGASNVMKMLQKVEESKREDCVKSIVYEANARLRDPVYGSSGAICHLQKQVQELELQLESMRTKFLESQEQRNQLLKILMDFQYQCPISPIDDVMFDRGSFFLDDGTVPVLGYNPIEFPLHCDWIL